MQPRVVGIMRWTAVAGLISEQSEYNASPPTAVIHALTHDSRARNVHLLDSRGRLNAGDYAALCLPVLERLVAAVLISGLNTTEAAHGN